MGNMFYYLMYGVVWLITLLPLRVLYLFSDIAYPIVYYVVRYRKDVVRQNIKRSFPQKTEQELRKIERRYYRFFCDLMIETLYEMNISKAEINRRMTYSNVEAIKEQYAQGKSVMIMTAHYGNWEWTLNFPFYMPEGESSNPIYKQLRNPRFDKLIHGLRSKYGAQLIEKKELLRTMFRLQKEKKLGNFWMISDQTPNMYSIHYWTQFLNQDTPVVTGTETLARKFNYPVFYAEITCKKRGYYHCEFQPVVLDPQSASEFEISETYMRLLEKTIERQPEYWLWSHRRWKFTRNNS
jgi:KDO2-lipid IV(A) lauroyltransferase